MANPLRGEVAFGDRKLRFTTNGICVVEARTKTNMAQILVDLEEGKIPDFLTVRLVIWAGLLAGDKDMTIETAGEVLDQVGYLEAIKIAKEAMLAAHGPAVLEDGGREGTEKNG